MSLNIPLNMFPGRWESSSRVVCLVVTCLGLVVPVVCLVLPVRPVLLPVSSVVLPVLVPVPVVVLVLVRVLLVPRASSLQVDLWLIVLVHPSQSG